MINNLSPINSDIILCISSNLQLPDLERFCCVDKKIYNIFKTKIWNCIASNYGWKKELGMTSKDFLKTPLGKDSKCGFFDLIGKKIFTKSECFKLNLLNFFEKQISQGCYLEYHDPFSTQDKILFHSTNGRVMGYETSVPLLWDSPTCQSWINIKRERKKISVIMFNKKLECTNAPKLGALSLSFDGIRYGTFDLKQMIISIPDWVKYKAFKLDVRAICEYYLPKDYYLEFEDLTRDILYFFSEKGEFTYLATPTGTDCNRCGFSKSSPEYDSWITIIKERKKVKITINGDELICNLAPKITKF